MLDRAERTRMLKIAQAAEPSPLALAVEPAFTLEFTVEQLEAMLAQAKRKDAAHA